MKYFEYPKPLLRSEIIQGNFKCSGIPYVELCKTPPAHKFKKVKQFQVSHMSQVKNIFDMSYEVQKLKDEKIENLQASLHRKRNDKHELKTLVKELKCENAILWENNQRLQNELVQKSQHIEDLSTQLNQPQITPKPVEKSDHLSEQQLKLYQKRIQELEQSLKECHEQNQSLKLIKKNYETNISNLHQDLVQNKNALKQLIHSQKSDIKQQPKLKFPVKGLECYDIKYAPQRGKTQISEKWAKCLRLKIAKCLGAAEDGQDFVSELFRQINRSCNYDLEIMMYETGHLQGLSLQTISESFFEFERDGKSYSVCIFRI